MHHFFHLLPFILVAVATARGYILDEADKKLEAAIKDLQKSLAVISRQIILQQQFVEERIRSDADSGIKQVRHNHEGTRNYHAETHGTQSRVFSIHDHSNNIRTIGMGEFIAVLNGVEFRTRHNDYRLYMPSRSSQKWHATEEVPFPDVPPAVLGKSTVADQIKEMKEWFTAWKNQDYSVRDYRKYFKPVLCYLEGAWTTETSGPIDEPFSSDRHFVDAKSWFDLQEKIRYTSYTGRKDNFENFAFLPTTIMNVTENGTPRLAQWNYRILCHPLSRDLPLNRFRVIDELHLRLGTRRTYEQQSQTRAARFQLNPADTSTWKEGQYSPKSGLLDDLMNEIPGKDNYPASLTDESFSLPVYHIKSTSSKKLNTGYYHRWYKVHRRGAMGLQNRHRGFADENLFMAMNTQANVASMTLKDRCRWINRKKVCPVYEQRWSYAFPLEVIFLTPLSKWNPYNLEYKGDFKTDLAKTVTAGGRNGLKDKPFNGTNSKLYYLTPDEFFTGGEKNRDAADTTRHAVWVLDKHNGNMKRKVRASGIRIMLPNIAGIGTLRQRYPIAPVHGEGSFFSKELEAVKDMLLKSKTNKNLFKEKLGSC